MLNLSKVDRHTLVLIRDERATEKAPPILALFLHLEGHALAIPWYPTQGVFAPEPNRYNPEHVLRRAGAKDISPTARAAHEEHVGREVRIRDGFRASHPQPCVCIGCQPRGMR